MNTLMVLGVLFGILSTIGAIAFLMRIWIGSSKEALCPYTGTPLRRAANLPYLTKYRVFKFMKIGVDYYNQPFPIYKAAFCRETGRIFPDCVSWTGTIKLDWSFLQKKYPGKFVSWGSLSSEQRREIYEKHTFIYEGFQTDFSSPSLLPRDVEPEYAHSVPGPLYVDLETSTLLGWIQVPETEIEIMRVQRP